MCLIFVGQGYPRKLFNLEHFPIYGMYVCMHICMNSVYVHVAISFCSVYVCTCDVY